MTTGMIMALTATVAVGAVWAYFTYNGFVTKRNKVEEAFAIMDVCLTKRHDLVPSLANTVAGYARHEADALLEAVRNREGAHETNDKVRHEQMIGSAVKGAMVLAEAYPELKASDAFAKLQRQLCQIEEEIMFSRRYYNGCVREYNTMMDSFPSMLIAKMMRWERRLSYGK